ncbi:MAG: hypothetical protein ACI4S2_15380 [Lachnospiraceae bacterium]
MKDEKIEMKKENVVEIIGKHIGTITAVISALTAIVTGLFRGGAYLYSKGYYDFWKIPYQYIEVNYGNVLLNFLMMMTCMIAWAGFSGVYMECWYRADNKKSKLRINPKKVLLILLIVVIAAAVCVLYMLRENPLQIVLEYLRVSPRDFMRQVLLVSVLLFMMTWGMGQMYMGIILEIDHNTSKEGQNTSDKEEEPQKAQSTSDKVENLQKAQSTSDKVEDPQKVQNNPENENIKKNLNRLIISLFILLIPLAIAFEANSIYKDNRTTSSNANKVQVVDLEEASYIVIGQYKDKWILKECLEKDGEFKINYDHFMISNIEDRNIIEKTLAKGMTVEDCLVDNLEFQELKNQ